MLHRCKFQNIWRNLSRDTTDLWGNVSIMHSLLTCVLYLPEEAEIEGLVCGPVIIDVRELHCLHVDDETHKGHTSSLQVWCHVERMPWREGGAVLILCRA